LWNPPLGTLTVTLVYLVATVLFVWYLGHLTTISTGRGRWTGQGQLKDAALAPAAQI